MLRLIRLTSFLSLLSFTALFAIEKRDDDRDLFDRNQAQEDFNPYDYPSQGNQKRPTYNPYRIVADNSDSAPNGDRQNIEEIEETLEH